MNELVSVIIPVYNREKFLAEAIESVLKQTYKNIEIICINDGSTDASQEIIESFHDPRLKYFIQKNAGIPAARNKGIIASKGEYITFLDSDDAYLPTSIEERLQCLKNSPESAMVHTDAILIDSSSNIISDSVLQYQCRNALSGSCFKNLFLKGTNINTCSVIIRRDVFVEIGLFDESLQRAEDYDLWLRISYYYPILFMSKQLVKYRMHHNNICLYKDGGDVFVARLLIKAANNYSDIVSLIGKNDMCKRLYEVCFDAAYGYLKNGELKSARPWLFHSWIWGKKPKTLLCYLGTYGGAFVQKYYIKTAIKNINIEPNNQSSDF